VNYWRFFYDGCIFFIVDLLDLGLQILKVLMDGGLCLGCALAVLRSDLKDAAVERTIEVTLFLNDVLNTLNLGKDGRNQKLYLLVELDVDRL
jgi:hypothetical protein